jgi:hypothetical protein
MDDNRPEYLARMADGKLIRIYPDKFHYRAYNAPGVLMGDPFVQMGDLLKSLGATIVSAEGTGAPADWVHPEAAGTMDPGQQTAGMTEGGDGKENDAGGRDKSVNEAEPIATVPCPADADKWSRDKCGQWVEEIYKMDMEKCDGQCGEHASRAALAAQPANALPPLTGGEPVRDEDKNASETPGQPAE